MIAIEHGGIGQRRAIDDDAGYRGVAEALTTAEFPAMDYSLGYEAEIAAEVIRSYGLRTVGLVGTGNMPHRFVERLHALAVGVAFPEVTDAVDRFMVAKSDEEISLIRRSALTQDSLFDAVLAAARPGMRDIDVTAIARAEALKAGGVGGIILAGSGPQGTFAPFRPPLRQNRVVERGDYLSLLIENSGPGATSPNSPVPSSSASPRNRIFAHDQGYNLVERPLIRDDEPMIIEAGMNLAIHLTIADGHTVFAVMCDNFLVGPDGARERLHRTEQRIFEV